MEHLPLLPVNEAERAVEAVLEEEAADGAG